MRRNPCDNDDCGGQRVPRETDSKMGETKMSSIFKLDGVKIGRVSVQYNSETGELRIGTKGTFRPPIVFIRTLSSKQLRRAFRKMLYVAGYPNIAAATVAPKVQSKIRIKRVWVEATSPYDSSELPFSDDSFREWEEDQWEEDEKIYQQELRRQLERGV